MWKFCTTSISLLPAFAVASLLALLALVTGESESWVEWRHEREMRRLVELPPEPSPAPSNGCWHSRGRNENRVICMSIDIINVKSALAISSRWTTSI